MQKDRAENKRSISASAENVKSDVNAEEVRKAVREQYTKLAKTETPCCDQPASSCGCGQIYPRAEIVSLPSEAIAVSAGCGNPTAIANLKPGMTVVDLGSGGGIDVFLAAKKVGEKGRVIGIDATPEMIYRARKTARENGYENVEFRLGEIEHMPLERNTADVVISNCVINLSPDKQQVFNDAFRILKPGGRLAVSDIVLLKDLPEQLRKDLGSWSSCVGGAVSEKEYIDAIMKAGFEKVKIEERVVYTQDQLDDIIKGMPTNGLPDLSDLDLSQLVASYKISAIKPKK